MKTLFRLTFVFFFFVFVFGCNKNKDYRMAFVTTVYNIDWPENDELTKEEIKKSLKEKIIALKKNKVKVIIFQARPHAGVFYKSNYELQSPFLNKSNLDFDVLEYLVKLCKKEKLILYAWINPLRVSVSKSDKKLIDTFRQNNSDWLLKAGNTTYLNPGIPDVRDYVSDIVKEVVTQYDVDGILFDDYFYPSDGNLILDQEAYKKHNQSKLSIQDWRRHNITSLIKACYKQCKEENVKFIVSPIGIWRNKKNDENGSLSNGLSAYDDLYADTKLWCASGYVDMILPQLYFKIGQKNADFITIAKWWNDHKGKVDLGYALAPYKIDENNWDTSEIDNQIRYITKTLKNNKIAFYNTNAYMDYMSSK